MTKLSLTAVPLKPTRILETPCKKAKIYLFGMPHDFSPRGNLSIIMETLRFYAARNGVKNIFNPSCRKFNAKIIHAESLRNKIRLRGNLIIHQGGFADGVILTNKQEGFFIASADCPTIVACGEKFVITAHAGRDCLIDKKEIHTGKPSRKHRSVVDAIIEKFFIAKENTKKMRVFITCGIKSENFPHPINHHQYEEKNKTLIEYLIAKYGKDYFRGDPKDGLISLKDLIKTQFTLHGVPAENLQSDNIDTYSDNILGRPIWHSCARGKTPKEKKRRNGVLVMRNF